VLDEPGNGKSVLKDALLAHDPKRLITPMVKGRLVRIRADERMSLNGALVFTSCRLTATKAGANARTESGQGALLARDQAIFLPQLTKFRQKSSMSDPDDILELADKLEKAAGKIDRTAIQEMEAAALRAAKSWSGSWLGYHSRVYYENLQPVPPGARFSVEWGFGDRMSNETQGTWMECDFDAVVAQITKWGGSPDTDKLDAAAKKAAEIFEDAQATILSALSQWRTAHPEDKFLESLETEVKEEKVVGLSGFIRFFQGKQKFFTRDSVAAGQGMQTPPHFHVLGQVGVWRHPFSVSANLAKHARRAASHYHSLQKTAKRASRVGTHVFVGHGRSPVWKDLRDFIRDRVKLPCDEFNRVPVAGVTTIARLMQMLDDAAIAFIIMTAEDDQANGKVHARMNVIHEAGLFQGRLGFERAILLLEEGCEEFSNVHGLGQIRFPKGKISECFEEIRRVLEREELIDAPE
jgi:predicted nucleotide-binding protein